MKKLFSLLLAGALSCSMAWADVSLTAYKGSASNTEVISGTIAAATTAWNSILAQYPNAVAVGLISNADNQTFANTTGIKNVILETVNKPIGSKVSYSTFSCPNLVLKDLCDFAKDASGNVDYAKAAATNFYAPCSSFTVTAGSYSRELRGDYNSVCVPFEIANDGTFGATELLAYNEYKPEENNACFMYKTKISAGVPVIIDLTAPKTWTVDLAGKTVVGQPNQGTGFQGVFVTTDYAGTNSYSVNTSLEGKFSPLAGNLYPFRACFKLDGSSHNAAPRLVIVNADETTALDEVSSAKVEKVLVNGQILLRKNGQLFNVAGQLTK